jgi:hypothetical protein
LKEQFITVDVGELVYIVHCVSQEDDKAEAMAMEHTLINGTCDLSKPELSSRFYFWVMLLV